MDSFNSLPFEKRWSLMGDLSQKACEKVFMYEGIAFDKLGLDRAKVLSWKLPLMVRKLPDYIYEPKNSDAAMFRECKGVGADGILKVKLEDITAFELWCDMLCGDFFFFNSSKNIYSVISLLDFKDLVKTLKTARFPNDGNLYYEVPTEKLTWTTL